MIRLGILGAGATARQYLLAAAQHPETEVAHIADENEGSAQELAQEFGVPSASKKLQAITSDKKGIDAVIVSLPTHRRREWIMRSAKAGKDILCAAPMCRTPREARDVDNLCRRCSAELVVGYLRRYSPARLKAREIIQSGELGRPVMFTASTMGVCDAGPGDWLWHEAKGGGLILDQATHEFDYACFVLGVPFHVAAQCTRICAGISAPSQGSAIVTFPLGDSLLYGGAWQEASVGAVGGPSAVIGPRGTIVFESDFRFRWHTHDGQVKTIGTPPDELEPKGLGKTWLYYQQLDDFAATLRTGKRSASCCSPDQAMESLWIAHTIVTAGATGRSERYKGRRRPGAP